ncbi:MAG TPA: membrane dipeptidase [Gaiellaceae bacterium]|nr:membrane dipeptidase [Gaiellaceae bacterium]
MGEIVNIYCGGVIHDVLYRHQIWVDGPGAQVLRERHVPRWREGGLTGAVVQVAAYPVIATILAEIDRSEGELVFCRNRADFDARPEGSFGIFMSLEGHAGMAGDLDALHLLAEIGVTAFTFSHNMQNILCTGCNERFGEGGFTHVGKATLKELAKVPLMVDLVHMSRASFWDALDLYDGDLFVSHSNAAAVFEHPRNLTDDQIKAVAERNGVIGLNTFRGYVTPDPYAAKLSDLVDHAMHMYDLVGAEHLSIGADYSSVPELLHNVLEFVDPENAQGVGGADGVEIYKAGPEGIEDESKFDRIGAALLERGLSEEEVRLVNGESYLRMLARARG